MTFSPLTNSRMNVYESLRAGSMATLLDSLQSQLKLRDGDIAQLQVIILFFIVAQWSYFVIHGH